MGAFVVIIYLAVIGLMLASMWKIYEKAGKPGWAAIIPIYNIIVLLEIVGKPWWWLFLMCIPVVNIIVAIIIYNLLSKSFGQGAGFTAGLILLSIVFFPMLAFGDYTFQGAEPQAPADRITLD